MVEDERRVPRYLTGEGQWKSIPLRNCGGDKFERDQSYVISGGFAAELMQMASLLSSGDAINADTRRDMGQRIQGAMRNACLFIER